jgi:HTH-type transcriptional regulator, bacterioopsin transcriptional activator and related proteins
MVGADLAYPEGFGLTGESLNSTKWGNVPSMAATIPNHRQDLLEQQVAILTMIARDESFVDTIGAVIALAERLEPGSLAGVTIVDRAERTLERAVFGSVDRAFSDAIAGVPLGPPHVGTCAQALYRGEEVTSENLAADTRFAKEWIQLCQDHGIRSCRSQPIRTPNGNPLGTFMLCYREPRELSRFDNQLTTVCASLAELALER